MLVEMSWLLLLLLASDELLSLRIQIITKLTVIMQVNHISSRTATLFFLSYNPKNSSFHSHQPTAKDLERCLAL